MHPKHRQLRDHREAQLVAAAQGDLRLITLPSVTVRTLVVILTTLFVFGVRANAQNLVPNSSFEDTVQCPVSVSELANSQGWFSPNLGTPDYMNACNGGIVGVPVNGWGVQVADSGNAYAGFGVLVRNDVREYLCIQLTDTLQAQEQYCISFYVSLAENSYAACNSIGAMFLSDTATIQTVGPYFISSMVNDSIMLDSTGWHELTFLYNAVGDERFLLLGVLKPDSMLTTQWVDSDTVTYSLAYYYVDNVAVRKCDTGIPGPDYPELSMFPNPSNGEITFNGNFPSETVLRVYNMLGEVVLEPVHIPQGNNSVAITLDVAQGLYYYDLTCSNGEFASGKLIIQR